MEYSEVKRITLEIINQYSIAGETISLTYNNQADYTLKIPHLINSALLHIYAEIRPESAVCRLVESEIIGDMRLYAFPSNFGQLKSGGVRRLSDGQLKPVENFEIMGRNILVPNDSVDGCYLIEYYRIPEQLPADPPDHYSLNESHEIIYLACLYAAAFLVVQEDEFVYSTLYNEFQNRLASLRPAKTAEVHPICDVYRGE